MFARLASGSRSGKCLCLDVAAWGLKLCSLSSRSSMFSTCIMFISLDLVDSANPPRQMANGQVSARFARPCWNNMV